LSSSPILSGCQTYCVMVHNGPTVEQRQFC